MTPTLRSSIQLRKIVTMAPQNPSIQSFFLPSPTKPSSSVSIPSSPAQPTSFKESIPGDGFTPDEIEAVLHPPSVQWIPTQDYEEADIGALAAGPKFVTFMGRVVNFYDMAQPSKRPLAAQGYQKVVVADDTGVLTVKLWYAKTAYKLHLGQLVTVWTVHISHGGNAFLVPASTPLYTSIFPERERSCHIMFHENSDNGTMCKKPYGCKDLEALPGLMTVKNFTDGGYDVDDCKVLVCVKSIGARKKFTNRKGTTSDIISIGVFDDTAEASLTLYGPTCASASRWRPSYTILLISNPSWRIDRMAFLSLNANTRLDVDPDMNDAVWLRSFAQRLTKKEHVNPPFPDGVFDTEAAETASVRILYNLADIDEFARSNPKERFMGYISVVITQLNIVTNYRRQMLMCTECCGIPLYANSVAAQCKQCEKTVPLRINPRILGPLIDETGQLSTGKAIFSNTAWHQLLGRTAAQLIDTSLDVLRYLEHRLLFLRVSMGFGWCLEGSGALSYRGVDGRTRGGNGNGHEERGDVLGKRKRQDETTTHTPARHRNDNLGEVGRLCIWCVKM
ncbi:hypothetical protein CC78DRAFT_74412 [Lojkania enalia]|uniref:Nucleic acid-binding protein n=1 Tax=Lojkania enalia TaxID=147567 RepID=A0A9P4JZF6_9PLEO|nr:hypothetical protein CC78DRAFT_74412 [Didymosphaeria enalia]